MTDTEKLKAIGAIFETITTERGTSVSDHLYYNLEGAIIDIKRTGMCDRTCMNTLERVRNQIGKIGKILND